MSPTSSRTSVPARARGQQTIAALDENGEPFKALVKKLVDKRVALTSTLTVFETFTRGRPMPPGLDVLTPQLKDSFERALRAGRPRTTQSVYPTLFPKAMRARTRVRKAGGLLVAGTDPTGAGGVVPGYANQRQIELLVEAGFTPLEAISIGDAERREVSRPRRADRQPSRSASRPIWSSSPAIRRRPSPTCAASRPCSRTASATIR